MRLLALLFWGCTAGAVEFQPSAPRIAAVRMPAAATAVVALPLAAVTQPALPALSALPLTAAAAQAGARPAASEVKSAVGQLEVVMGVGGPAKAAARGQGPGEEAPDFRSLYDGDDEQGEARQEELVLVERAVRKQEAVLYAHAEIPTMDYRRTTFSEAQALQFSAKTYEFAGGQRRSGRQLLEMLVTPQAARTDMELDLARSDPSAYGLSGAEIREAAQREGLPPFAYHDVVQDAYLRGLVYRINDGRRQKTFYGVPQIVREALDLLPPPAAPRSGLRAPETRPTPFGSALAGLALQAQALPAKDELFEFVAQAVEAAVDLGQARRGDFSDEFTRRAAAIGFAAPPLSDALIVLLESSHGTTWFARAEKVCQAAAAEGILEPTLLEDALAGLR